MALSTQVNDIMKIGTAVVIGLALTAGVAYFAVTGIGRFNANTAKADSKLSAVEQSEHGRFNGVEVSGSAITNYLVTYSEGEDLGILVENKKGIVTNYLSPLTISEINIKTDSNYIVGEISSTGTPKLDFSKTEVKSSDEYISPTGKYNSYLIKSNGVVIGYAFQKVGIKTNP